VDTDCVVVKEGVSLGETETEALSDLETDSLIEWVSVADGESVTDIELVWDSDNESDSVNSSEMVGWIVNDSLSEIESVCDSDSV
jgi:hypothetical protein